MKDSAVHHDIQEIHRVTERVKKDDKGKSLWLCGATQADRGRSGVNHPVGLWPVVTL